MIDLTEAFERHDDEYLKFERVEKPVHPRRDVCAFIMLHELDPNSNPAVSAAAHDEIWLDFDAEVVAAAITDDQVRDLTRCGVRWDEDMNCFAMFA